MIIYKFSCKIGFVGEKFTVNSPKLENGGTSPNWTVMDMGVQRSAPAMPQDSHYSVTVGPGPLGVALIADESKQFILVELC